MKLIGLTGVMGAGKSSVIKILGQMQIKVLDCDKINADLCRIHEQGYDEVVAAFGTCILNDMQEIDTQKLSNLIFQNPEKKAQLEGILHPLIKQEIRHEVALCHDEMLVVEVPLLFEVKWESFFDEVWVVGCKEAILLERLQTYRYISKEEAQIRLAHQMPQEEKLKRGDVVLMNDGDITNLQMQIEAHVARIAKEPYGKRG